MSSRLNKITTRQGDDGSTGLADGSRLQKDDQRIECLGQVDELNASLGLVSSQISDSGKQQLLLQIQHDLFDVGAELSLPEKSLLIDSHLMALDQAIEQYNELLPPLKEFILPGGSESIALFHLSRTICRRVERQLVALNRQLPVNPLTLKYFNRLSDLLFILARHQALSTNAREIYWQSEYSRR